MSVAGIFLLVGKLVVYSHINPRKAFLDEDYYDRFKQFILLSCEILSSSNYL